MSDTGRIQSVLGGLDGDDPGGGCPRPSWSASGCGARGAWLMSSTAGLVPAPEVSGLTGEVRGPWLRFPGAVCRSWPAWGRCTRRGRSSTAAVCRCSFWRLSPRRVAGV